MQIKNGIFWSFVLISGWARLAKNAAQWGFAFSLRISITEMHQHSVCHPVPLPPQIPELSSPWFCFWSPFGVRGAVPGPPPAMGPVLSHGWVCTSVTQQWSGGKNASFLKKPQLWEPLPHFCSVTRLLLKRCRSPKCFYYLRVPLPQSCSSSPPQVGTPRVKPNLALQEV